MANQGFEVLKLLEAHCLPGMDPAIKRTLILECSGRSHKEIGDSEGASESTVDNWVRVGMAEIALCLPEGVRPSKMIRGYWVGKHSTDCLAHEVAKIRERSARWLRTKP